MYRSNLPHHKLQSCNGDCFDDLCSSCRDYIKSSDDESSFDQFTTVDSFANPFTRQRSANSYCSDDEAGDDELNRLSQLAFDRAYSLEKHFRWFNGALDRLDGRLLQLHRQNDHCSDLRSSFEEFLRNFQQQTGSVVNCDEWFMQLNVLRVMLDEFDDDIEPHIARLNDHIERLYDFFDRDNRQLTSAAQTLRSLESHSIEQRFVCDQIAKARLQLNCISSNLEEEVQEQREIIIEFVGMMDTIVQGVQSALTSNEFSAEFNSFTHQQFLHDFNKTLNQIQII